MTEGPIGMPWGIVCMTGVIFCLVMLGVCIATRHGSLGDNVNSFHGEIREMQFLRILSHMSHNKW